jgi:hypothetical protein
VRVLNMTRLPAKPARPRQGPAGSLAEAESIGRALCRTVGQVVKASPVPVKPSSLEKRLKFSRVLISRILNAIRCEEPLEALQRIPGPESLRTFVVALGRAGVDAKRVQAALKAIDRFDVVIRERFGSRSLLNAAICPRTPEMTRQLELQGRQRVFSGMRDLRGGEADAWVAAHMLAPDRDDPSRVSAVVLQGFLGLRHVRSDISVYFDYLPVYEPGPPRVEMPGLEAVAAGLERHYVNPPARVESARIFRLVDDQVGAGMACDMLSVVGTPRCISRFAASPGRRTGPFVLVKIPLKMLHLDVLIAEGLPDPSPPELFVFSPGPRAGTNVNDRIDDLDRVTVPERVEVLESGPERFEVPCVPNYRAMLEGMADALGQDLDSMRIHRVSVPYPPFGHEFVNTFRLRPAPSPGG